MNELDTQSPFDRMRHVDPDGSEWWSARELGGAIGYATWYNFESVIQRAIEDITNLGEDAGKHISSYQKVSPTGNARYSILDYRLTRYGAYWCMVNSSKPDLKRYFVVKTREAEVTQEPLTGRELMAAALVEANRVLAEREARLAIAAPKADAYDQWLDDTNLIGIRDANAMLVEKFPHLKMNWLGGYLVSLGWLYRDKTSVTVETERQGWMVNHPAGIGFNGKERFRPMLTKEGFEQLTAMVAGMLTV